MTQTQGNPNSIIMSSQVTLGGENYIIRVWQTEEGGFSPMAFDLRDESDVYIGGEDDEDAETPEAAIELGRRLLNAQYERGSLDA